MNDLSLAQKESGVGSDQIIVLKNPNKTKHTVMPAKDQKTRWWAGIPRLSDDDKKDMKFHTSPESRITLEDGIEFDLSNEVDRANWEWLKHLKEISPDLESYKNSPMSTFYVYIEGRESRSKNKTRAEVFKAEKYVFEDSPTNYEDRALLLGHEMSGENPEVILEFLLDQATNKKTAKKVIEMYESKSLSLQLLYFKAKRSGHIKEVDNTIRFGMNILGTSDGTAIAFLQEPANKEIINLIDQAINPEIYAEKLAKESKRFSTQDAKDLAKKNEETK